MSFDRRRIDGIRNMVSHDTGEFSQQLFCAIKWIRDGIPEFSLVIRPLADLLEKVYTLVGKRTKLASGRISLPAAGWNYGHEDELSCCKQALEHQVTLAHVNYSKSLFVYTDASDYFWSVIVTHIPVADAEFPCADQHHEPLPFLSAHFKESSLRWFTIEKEAYAILATT